MPDDGSAKLLSSGGEAASHASGRGLVLAFTADAQSEAVLRLGLAGAEQLSVRRGGVREAVAAMSRLPTPRVLIVDVSGDDQPLTALAALSEVVEPEVRVLAVGDRQDVNLYRQLTRTLGVAEYLYKPLSAEVVAQHFGPFVNPAASANVQVQGGRVLAITGVRGGAGCTTIAANLAWHLAEQTRRHTVLLDADLHTGTAAALLGAKTGGGLRTAIEAPERVDELFIERIAQPAGDRLAVIAGEEGLAERPVMAAGGALRLLKGLRRRFNYVVVDLPMSPAAWTADLLDEARQRILVLEPTLAAVREALRVLALPAGAQQIRRPLIVLNKLGTPGAMTRREIEDALQRRADVTVPFLPRAVNLAATMGVPAAAARGGLLNAVRELAGEVAAGGLPLRRAGLLGWLRAGRAGR